MEEVKEIKEKKLQNTVTVGGVILKIAIYIVLIAGAILMIFPYLWMLLT